MRSLLPAVLFIAAMHAWAAPVTVADLTGQWDYRTFTGMLHDHPTGKLELKPGSMVVTYSKAGEWKLETAEHEKRRGHFVLKGSELIMKDADGSVYQDFQVELAPDGKQMTLKDSDSVIVAARVKE